MALSSQGKEPPGKSGRFNLLLLLLVVSSTGNVVVIRHDVDDAKYQIPASDFPVFADMPGEGHGVLIAPQWSVTTGHTVPGRMAPSIMMNMEQDSMQSMGRQGAELASLVVEEINSGRDDDWARSYAYE